MQKEKQVLRTEHRRTRDESNQFSHNQLPLVQLAAQRINTGDGQMFNAVVQSVKWVGCLVLSQMAFNSHLPEQENQNEGTLIVIIFAFMQKETLLSVTPGLRRLKPVLWLVMIVVFIPIERGGGGGRGGKSSPTSGRVCGGTEHRHRGRPAIEWVGADGDVNTLDWHFPVQENKNEGTLIGMIIFAKAPDVADGC
ncbi:hypothetical protein BDK51DRAFT_28125 [Blyttiomyces helicus]|uniref:Uncharacterized protein n=1 Tax=Blyttiomyces helicus TaxID=388810 RepID=A0A4P9W519_9FUNG|nr:hypothetical protein BDK51DRAFT_28125 [Blyttiomyces helicus]|eukprot:RKO87032.1 hypothetical protein BDK51DRAFT_28125 [Blyttiomyces helicus]